MPDPLLEIRDLRVSFRTEAGVVRAVDGLSLTVGTDDVVGIVGESGSGKTVSMMAVMRLIRDPKLRAELVANAQEYVRTQRNEVVMKREWLAALSG